VASSDYVAGGVPERLVPRAAGEEALVVAGRRRGPGVAMWGMAMLVASEVTLFGTFIGTYYYLRFESPHWPPPGTPEPRVAVPLIMVGILVATSLPMLLAISSAYRLPRTTPTARSTTCCSERTTRTWRSGSCSSSGCSGSSRAA
jgi:hypothetical protein